MRLCRPCLVGCTYNRQWTTLTGIDRQAEETESEIPARLGKQKLQDFELLIDPDTRSCLV